MDQAKQINFLISSISQVNPELPDPGRVIMIGEECLRISHSDSASTSD